MTCIFVVVEFLVWSGVAKDARVQQGSCPGAEGEQRGSKQSALLDKQEDKAVVEPNRLTGKIIVINFKCVYIYNE